MRTIDTLSTTRSAVEETVYAETALAQELSTEDNGFGQETFGQYQELLFGEDVSQKLRTFAEQLTEELRQRNGQDPVFELASMDTCVRLSQAAGRVAQKWNARYPDSDLRPGDLSAIYDALESSVAAVSGNAALVQVMKKHVSHIFDLYKDYPLLAIDDIPENYETSILAERLLLEASDGNERYAHPVLLAKQLIGFRDIGGRVALVAPVDDATLQYVDTPSYQTYREHAQEYLRASPDYDDCIVHQSRRHICHDVFPAAELFPEGDVGRLMQEMHKPGLRYALEEVLGTGLEALSFEAQHNVLEFSLQSDTDRFERLGAAMKTVPESDRPVLCEAFLATEFGDDLGDILLSLTEKARDDNGEQQTLLDIVHALQDIRTNGAAIADVLAAGDGELRAAISTAFIKRTTELLALADAGQVGQARDALRVIQEMTAEISAAFQGSFAPMQMESDFLTLQATGNNRTTLTIRSRGDVQRIGMTVRRMGHDKKQRVNIRLDREEDGLSLDIGSSAKQGVNSSQLAQDVGRALALGELELATIRAQQNIQTGAEQQQITLQGNHVREAFESLGPIGQDEFEAMVMRVLYSLSIQHPTADQK